MNPKELATLKRLLVGPVGPYAAGKWVSSVQLPHSAQTAALLVRKGYAKGRTNSEHTRGEARTYWREYAITEAGRIYLEAQL